MSRLDRRLQKLRATARDVGIYVLGSAAACLPVPAYWDTLLRTSVPAVDCEDRGLGGARRAYFTFSEMDTVTGDGAAVRALWLTLVIVPSIFVELWLLLNVSMKLKSPPWSEERGSIARLNVLPPTVRRELDGVPMAPFDGNGVAHVTVALNVAVLPFPFVRMTGAV